jgi:hypothetical protein
MRLEPLEPAMKTKFYALIAATFVFALAFYPVAHQAAAIVA